MIKLCPRQATFVREYLVDLNLTQAAIRAGYRSNNRFSYGWVLLRNPRVAEAIRLAMDERARRTEITGERVLRELAAIAFSDIGKVATWKPRAPQPAEPGAGGRAHGPDCELWIRDSTQLDPATRAAVAKVRHYARHGVTIEMHDKLGALALLGKHLGLFVDRYEVTAAERLKAKEAKAMKEGLVQLTQDQRDRVRAVLKEAAEDAARK